MTLVGVFRYCPRCARWRRVGNFTHSLKRGRPYMSHVCRRCCVAGTPRLSYGRFWTITNKGRKALREVEAA